MVKTHSIWVNRLNEKIPTLYNHVNSIVSKCVSTFVQLIVLHWSWGQLAFRRTAIGRLTVIYRHCWAAHCDLQTLLRQRDSSAADWVTTLQFCVSNNNYRACCRGVYFKGVYEVGCISILNQTTFLFKRWIVESLMYIVIYNQINTVGHLKRVWWCFVCVTMC